MKAKTVRRCALCGKMLDRPNPYVLYHSEKTQKETFSCGRCADFLMVLMEAEDRHLLRHALSYFAGLTERIRRVGDEELRAVLAEIFEEGAARAGLEE